MSPRFFTSARQALSLGLFWTQVALSPSASASRAAPFPAWRRAWQSPPAATFATGACISRQCPLRLCRRLGSLAL